MILRIQSSFDFFKNSFWKWKFLFWKLKHYFRDHVENQNFFQHLECQLRNWDFHFGYHFEKAPFGDVNLDCRSQKSHFENFSWKLKFDLKVQKSYNILEITVLFWVIKNFILIVKKCFQSFHFHLSTWEERIQFFVLEIRTWFYFYNNCLGS